MSRAYIGDGHRNTGKPWSISCGVNLEILGWPYSIFSDYQESHSWWCRERCPNFQSNFTIARNHGKTWINFEHSDTQSWELTKPPFVVLCDTAVLFNVHPRLPSGQDALKAFEHGLKGCRPGWNWKTGISFAFVFDCRFGHFFVFSIA